MNSKNERFKYSPYPSILRRTKQKNTNNQQMQQMSNDTPSQNNYHVPLHDHQYLPRIDTPQSDAEQELIGTSQNFGNQESVQYPQMQEIQEDFHDDNTPRTTHDMHLQRLDEPYRFEAGETAETIQALSLRDESGIIETAHLRKKLLYELYVRKITRDDLLQKLFGEKHVTLSDLRASRPRAYYKMISGKMVIEKICEWLLLCEDDKKAVLEGRKTWCCPFKVMRIDSNSDCTNDPPYPEVDAFSDGPPQNKYYDTSFDQYFPQLDDDSQLTPPRKTGKEQKRVLKFDEPYKFEDGESAETIQALKLRDKNGMIDTVNVKKRVRYELHVLRSSGQNFYRKVFGKDGAGRHLFSSNKIQKPYDKMKTGKVLITKAYKWLNLCDDDRKAVLEGKKTKCCQFEVMRNEDIDEEYNPPIEDPGASGKYLKPYQFEAGESAETLQKLPLQDKNGKVDTRNVIKRFQYELFIRECSNAKFLNTITGYNDSVKRFFYRMIKKSKTKTNMMATERYLFEKAHNWLMLCDNDKKAILEGQSSKCCQFRLMGRMNSNSERSGFEGYPPYPVVYVRNDQESSYHREIHEMPEDDPLQNKHLNSSLNTCFSQMQSLNTSQENADQNLIGTSQNFADQANAKYQPVHEMPDYASIQPQNTYCNLTNITYPMMQSSNGPPDNENLNCIGRTENIGHSEFQDFGESTGTGCFHQKSGSNLQKSRSIFKHRRVSRSTKFLKPYKFEAGESAETIQALPLRDKYGMSDCTGNEEHRPYPKVEAFSDGPPQNKYYDTSFDQYFPQLDDDSQLTPPRKTGKEQKRVLKFDEPYKFEDGESAETIQALKLRDKNGMIDTVNVKKRVRYELHVLRSSGQNFYRKVFGKDGAGRHLFSSNKIQKPYDKMKIGKVLITKAYKWLNLCDDDRKAVLEGKKTKCCQFEVMGNEDIDEEYNPPIEDPGASGKYLKPYQFETGESAETLQKLPLQDKNGKVDTRNVIKRFQYELFIRECSNAKFLNSITGYTESVRRAFYRMIKKSKTNTNMMANERYLFEKAHNWLMLCDNDKKAILEGQSSKCCQF